jgi:hypothetical protein
MQNQLFEAALGIAKPWYVRGVDFGAARKLLTIGIDFVPGNRFAVPGVEGCLGTMIPRPSGAGSAERLPFQKKSERGTATPKAAPKVLSPCGKHLPHERLSVVAVLELAAGRHDVAGALDHGRP